MNKEERYKLLTAQMGSLIAGETDSVAMMANVCAAIQETMGFFWTGFYRVVGDGVCGTAWKQRETIVVPDVEQFPGHIACSSLSRSEIVVPVFDKAGEVVAVLDIDSKELATFDDTDREYLEKIVNLFAR